MFRICKLEGGPSSIVAGVSVGHELPTAHWVDVTVVQPGHGRKIVAVYLECVRSLNPTHGIYYFEGFLRGNTPLELGFTTPVGDVFGAWSPKHQRGWMCERVGQLDGTHGSAQVIASILGKLLSTNPSGWPETLMSLYNVLLDNLVDHPTEADQEKERILRIWIESHPAEAITWWQSQEFRAFQRKIPT